mgnify:CR=1 FL=1
MSMIQWPYYSAANAVRSSNGQNSANNGIMGKDEFLKILITQLQNQDPASPLQDREFIAQMAQFSTLEQMLNMTEEIRLLRQSIGASSAMIGLEAEWARTGATGSIESGSGVITAIRIRDGRHYAEIGNELIDLDHIIAVKARSGGDG